MWKFALLLLLACPLFSQTSYANPGGTGNRTSTITVTVSTIGNNAPSTLVNGNTSSTVFYFSGIPVSGETVKFDFGARYVIDEAKFYESSATAQGTWQWQGSNDNSSWTSIGSSFAITGSPGPQVLTSLSSNAAAYRYYRMLGVSGSGNNGPWVQQLEFKISLVVTSSGGGFPVVM